MSDRNKNGGCFFVLLYIIGALISLFLAGLRLVGVIEMSWGGVILPFAIGFGILILAFVGYLFFDPDLKVDKS